MNFAEFQDTFFNEWKTGAFMILARMRDQLLPILRASEGFQEYGLDVINKSEIEGVDVWMKYAILLGWDKPYSSFFIGSEKFPTRINDPRGDPRHICKITVKSHREYLEIAKEAVIENMARFDLPERYFSKGGRLLSLDKPTLDEMGPHAERGVPVAGKPRPVKTIDIPDETEKKKHRHGRPAANRPSRYFFPSLSAVCLANAASNAFSKPAI